MFRTVLLSIIRSFSLYTQQWFMSYRFADSLRAGSGRNSVLILIASCRILFQKIQVCWLVLSPTRTETSCISRILWNSEVHYHIHNSPLPVRTLAKSIHSSTHQTFGTLSFLLPVRTKDLSAPGEFEKLVHLVDFIIRIRSTLSNPVSYETFLHSPI